MGFIIENNNNWDKELPDRLKSEVRFMIKIENDTLNDTFVEDGKVYISTEFDGELYSKEILKEDIAGFFDIKSMKVDYVKPFSEKPELQFEKPKKKFNLDDIKQSDIQKSMEVFKKYNPELFS